MILIVIQTMIPKEQPLHRETTLQVLGFHGQGLVKIILQLQLHHHGKGMGFTPDYKGPFGELLQDGTFPKILWVYMICASDKDSIESIWKGETKLGRGLDEIRI